MSMKRKKRNKAKVLTGILLIFTYLMMGWFLLYIDRPVDKTLPAKTVKILPGTGFSQVVGMLQREGFVRNPPFFYLLVLIKGAARHLRAGEYEFSGKMTPPDHRQQTLPRGNQCLQGYNSGGFEFKGNRRPVG